MFIKTISLIPNNEISIFSLYVIFNRYHQNFKVSFFGDIWLNWWNLFLNVLFDYSCYKWDCIWSFL